MPDTAVNESIRLLRCNDCLTLEELPDFDGPPEYDTLLITLMDRHRFPNGEPHRGRLIKVETRAWGMSNLRQALIEQIWAGSKGIAELDASFYDVKNTFQEDAIKCYQQHLRPQEGCPDWRSESKILKPDTKADRKEAGLSTTEGMPVIHLCSFCPCRSFYERKQRGE
jgi:hypothetical protein